MYAGSEKEVGTLDGMKDGCWKREFVMVLMTGCRESER